MGPEAGTIPPQPGRGTRPVSPHQGASPVSVNYYLGGSTRVSTLRCGRLAEGGRDLQGLPLAHA